MKMLPLGAELFKAEIDRQFRQDESSSLLWQDKTFFFLATLQVQISIVEMRRVRHRANSVSQEWKEIIEARTSSCELSDTLWPVYAKIRIY
jgi:hypothetical protein